MKHAIWVVVVLASAAGCGGTYEVRKAEGGREIPVEVAQATPRVVPQTVEVGGTVRARSVAVLTSRIVGQVREIVARPGARVRRGALVAILDGRELDASRDRAEALHAVASNSEAAAVAEKAAAEAGLRLALVTHGRIAQLRERRSATAQELDEAQAALSAAQARAAAAAASLAAAKANVTGASAAVEASRVAAGYSRIVAPFDGTVTERHLDHGAMTMPGTPVVTIEEAGGFEVEVRVDESRVALVDWGAAPRVLVSEPAGEGRTLEGRVVERALALDSSHTLIVKVALPASSAVRSGMFARVSFAGAGRRALTVPADAIVDRGQLDAVFVVDAGRARYRVIETGQRSGDLVEVRSGLESGERIVRNVPPSLVDGARVSVSGGAR